MLSETHSWIPDAEHGSVCSRCDVPRFSSAARQGCMDEQQAA